MHLRIKEKEIFKIYITLKCFLCVTHIYICEAVLKFWFFFLNKEGIIEKKIPWAPRFWVGRREEPILGYVPENDEKRIHAFKG